MNIFYLAEHQVVLLLQVLLNKHMNNKHILSSWTSGFVTPTGTPEQTHEQWTYSIYLNIRLCYSYKLNLCWTNYTYIVYYDYLRLKRGIFNLNNWICRTKSESYLFLYSRNLLDYHSCGMNLQGLFCSQKTGVKCSY